MKFSTGLLIGFGVGYVLGSKAGRERYEQMHGYYRQAERKVRDVAGDERVDAITAKTQAVVDATSERARGVMSSGLDTASKTMRNAAENDGESVLEAAPDPDEPATG